MFIGNVVNTMSQAGALFVLSRMGSTDTVGAYAIAFSFVQPTFALCCFELRNLLITENSNRFEIGDFFRLRFVGTVLAIVTCLSLSLWYEKSEVLHLILLAAFVQAVDGVTDIVHAYIQRNEKMVLIATSLIIRSVLSLLALTVTFGLTQSLIYSLAAVFLARLAIFMSCDLSMMWRLHQPDAKHRLSTWNQHRLKSLLMTSFPFSALQVVVTLRQNLPRILFWFVAGEHALGVFVIALSLMTPFEMLIRSVYQSILPRVSKYHETADVDSIRLLITKTSHYVCLLVFAAIVANLAFGRLVMEQVFLVEGDHLTWLMGCVALTSGLRSSLHPTVAVSLSSRRINPLLAIHGLELSIACVGTVFLARTGPLGVAFSLMIAAGVAAICSNYLFRMLLAEIRPADECSQDDVSGLFPSRNAA